MAEWSIAAVLKTVELRGSGGSNPSLSAKWLQDDFKMVVKTAFKVRENRCRIWSYNDFSLCISYIVAAKLSYRARYSSKSNIAV